MKNSLQKLIGIFLLLNFLFFPLTFQGKDWQFWLTSFVFGKFIKIIQDFFFPDAIVLVTFSSDTVSLILLLATLFVIAFIVVLFLRIKNIKSDGIVPISRTVACYYIAFVLLKYGCDKIFKAQFYLPEPNILYTPFGHLGRDTLYWSTMGTSRFFSVSMGIIEGVTALLILYKRTRVLGLLFAIGVLIQILLINFGFDVSVKTFSSLLLLSALFAMAPFLKTIYNFLVLRQQQQLAFGYSISSRKYALHMVKFTVISGMFIAVLLPYVEANNFNDDNQERLFLHGVYIVENVIKGKDTLDPCDFPIKRIFVHRNSYLIFQDQDQEMTDYFFQNDAKRNELSLSDYDKNTMKVRYRFSPSDSILVLQFKGVAITAKGQNWKKLPALQDHRHFFVDEVY